MRLDHWLVRVALLCAIPTVSAGCPWWDYNDYDYEPYYWCPDPGAEPAGMTPTEVAADERLEVVESEVAILASAAETAVDLPITSGFDLGAVTVSAWFQRFDSDDRLGERFQEVDLSAGRRVVRLRLPAMSYDELRQTRLAYRVTLGGETEPMLSGLVAVSRALDSFRIQVSAPSSALEGTAVPVRIFGNAGGRAESDFEVEAEVAIGGHVQTATVTASALGVANVNLELPPDVQGGGTITVRATPRVGLEAVTTLPIAVVKGGALLVTSDKPRYQPGQTMHLRVMALQRPEMKPVADTDVLVEILDGKGYKVFKQPLTTNAFGIAHTTFQLASEVNMGTYDVRVTRGEELTVEQLIVERYVLPKFKVDVNLAKNYVVAGTPLSGTVDVRYTFGEPAAHSGVGIELAYGDGQLIASLDAAADAQGRLSFELPVGGLAATDSVKLTVKATDTAGQEATREMALKTASQGIGVWMVPSRDRVAGEPWTVFVIARDPTGRPVEANGTARLARSGVRFSTNRLGIAEVTFPADVAGDAMIVTMTSLDGVAGTETFAVGATDFPAGIGVQAGRARYAAGQSASVTVQAPQGVEDVGIDVVQDGKVVSSTTTAVNSVGAGTVTLELDDALDGVVVIEAFAVDAEGQGLRGRTAVYVQSARKLRISADMDQDSYRPGGTATVDLTVTDRAGEGVPAALGVVVVDEAVYALQTLNPTSYNQFFSGQALPAEMTSVMPSQQSLVTLERGDRGVDNDAEMASRALLAAAAHRQATPDAFVDDVLSAERGHAVEAVNAQLVHLGASLDKTACTNNYGYQARPSVEDVVGEWADAHSDPWGQRYAVTATTEAYTQPTIRLRSAGPDETMNTDDDIVSELTTQYHGWM